MPLAEDPSVTEFEAALALPNPAEDLPERPPGYLPSDVTAVIHALRAKLAMQKRAAEIKAIRKKEDEAWKAMHTALEAKAEALEMMVRDWMIREHETTVRTPFFTVSLIAAKPKIVVDDEQKAISVCRILKAIAAYDTRYYLVKKEFDAVYNADPGQFKDIAHEDKGEAYLRIQEK